MGRRNRGGGGGSLQQTLRRRLESCKSRYSSAEDIVDHLRSAYPDYQRISRGTLVRLVRHALHSINNTPTLTPPRNHNENDEDDEGRSASRKRRNNINEAEDRLQKMEPLHSKKTMSKRIRSTSSDSASSESGSSGGGDGAVSEDAVYGEKGEPAFDLMKSSVSNCVGGGGVEVKEKKGPRFKDLGGMKEIFEKLRNDLVLFCRPELARELRMRPIPGILLHGPPGCGKTRLARAIAYETGCNFYHISATEVVSGVSGASEEKLRELFSKAKMNAPSIVFIDEIDAIASKRENSQRQMETRIVTQLMTCMDEADDSDEPPPGYVLVIGATNRLHAIEPALRRPGRFDLEILVGIPDESAREEILSLLTRDRKFDAPIDLRKIAMSTPGFVGADLAALTKKAANLAVGRILDERERKLSQDLMSEPAEDWWNEDRWKQRWSPDEINKVAVKMSDFEEAAKMVQPSLRREGFSPIPDVKWEDVGGLDHLRQEFDLYIIRRIKYPKDYEGLGINLETGFLLYGPPGCGKTLIAKAVANEAGANFIHVKGPEILNKYVGESELTVRAIFNHARTCAPCIIFFDEVDALTTERGKEGGRVTDGVLNQLLIELDGAEQRKGVFVIGATNRPEAMDRAVLRPGRFGKHLYVPLPSPDGRVSILKALARNMPVDANVDLGAIGRICENFSGADLAALMIGAVIAALKEKRTSTETTSDKLIIKPSHFVVSLSEVSPSVLEMQRQYFQHFSESQQHEKHGQHGDDFCSFKKSEIKQLLCSNALLSEVTEYWRALEERAKAAEEEARQAQEEVRRAEERAQERDTAFEPQLKALSGSVAVIQAQAATRPRRHPDYHESEEDESDH